MLRSLYVDLNSYFASVEQQLDPSLRGRPVAVVPVMADTTCAIAASYEAKKFGVTTGTIIADAKVKCPDLVLVHAKHTVYVELHHRIIDAVERVIHVKRVASIDEMVCDLTGSARNRDRALAIARDVKDSIHTHVGSEMRCSIGIAPNDYLAKTASDMQKPDGCVVLDEEIFRIGCMSYNCATSAVSDATCMHACGSMASTRLRCYALPHSDNSVMFGVV